jgi:hypothetical protein
MSSGVLKESIYRPMAEYGDGLELEKWRVATSG